MAKTYVDVVKYEIILKFTIEGIVDKPDIIGAIFGQSEGLIGGEFDLRELQESGKLGRIEIEENVVNGKTNGRLIVPSSMSMAETCVLAAAIETVDKVGPYAAKFSCEDIKDMRALKREMITERSKELLQKLMHEQIPESDIIIKEVKEGTRASEIIEYGPEKLPAGPAIDESEYIIVVEGRADVINMLKNNINNVIGLDGNKGMNTIIELGKRKKIIAFVDGDRGGELILRKLMHITNICFVSRAPAGKEVEELTRKEIVMALRNKIPANEYGKRRGERTRRQENFRKFFHREKPIVERFGADHGLVAEFRPIIEELKGTLKAKLLDEKKDVIKTIEIKDLLAELEGASGIHAVVFDGIITQRLVDAAANAGIDIIVGVKSNIVEAPPNVKLVVIS